MNMRDQQVVERGARCHQGRVASLGFAAGPIYRLEQPSPALAGNSGSASVTTPAGEHGRLERAIARARDELAGLVAAGTGEAADILAFQLALLEDDALSEPAFKAIEAGTGAVPAWLSAVGVLVADFEAAEEEYFRARTADLRDLEARVIDALTGISRRIDLPENAILVAEDLAPSQFLSMSWERRGIALEHGSATSHVAMLARSGGVPMLVGLGPTAARTGEPALLDAKTGQLLVEPDEKTAREFSIRKAELDRVRAEDVALAGKPALSADAVRIEVHVNIADPAELDNLDPALCDGIGLVRTEFLFHNRASLPDETEQARVYGRMLRWAQGRPVTIRTLDAGGDKPIPGLTLEGESNPFLGLRGLRLSLANPEIFKCQLRALLRAAPEGRLKIMIPMVSVPEEMDGVRELLAQARAELVAGGVKCGEAELGMMVEVPAAAIGLDLFTTDFVSIGSNDLVQYTMAAGRDCDAVTQLADAANPAVLRLIGSVVQCARRSGFAVSLCGEAGADARVLPLLLAEGLRSVSVAPARIGEVKRIVAGLRLQPAGGRRSRLLRRLAMALGYQGGARG